MKHHELGRLPERATITFTDATGAQWIISTTEQGISHLPDSRPAQQSRQCGNHERMEGQGMNADQVKELLSNATPGPWVHLTTEPFTGEIRGTESFTHIATEVDGNDANAALIAAAPAVAQWGLERDAEASWLRILLAQALKDYDVGAWRHSTRGGDDYPEPNWVTHARGILGSTS